ncbi:similar to Saccharomyces cerevisiae YOL117W RRI2 Subunit of the COP9 signalosome (CSN) complex that cleaves the ubiquitin-like protein Nedd8 from SCF ubiquitin ligases [Maudiozyma barnettii]|uniref:Similar to Saccharomyces cerevisiae YOL117W RRI2 Subunit of the COP9 signalosome (CSN) complex that cleaves the ubiquitin-like protein Nedd8 from SCF ubiquitin ligases n=1 Tax=Maudiozyma barnettii TaxID=61262 RepID=A0A8H2VK27_9SACH|nr:Rri2p [Kazachstania barnettii]CAB4256795.1 similar to Saccharomyces cerevisiae YOL117W RRI2 Subunit of the COP9 signalosome (CSN) complex that cleaves the ubiquitin-like protein Nedd8 from SCF ubiquitin ligases [Kazachstania barnettii]CAD1785448.1 similar to Saccharomyces cerevisiae YOL117W RRI2 Subunit of the COP9 signalosome (CSN) complex that cleaves the ubiquitin-like protein Nedd8 from SCF ubiquitin ligases [Kazachstania barnettii]
MFIGSDTEDSGNYDDFMYSDDDAMNGGDDMEFESDNEIDNNADTTGRNDPQQNKPELSLDERYNQLMETVDVLFEANNFVLAREKLSEFPRDAALASRTIFQVQMKILESWIQELKSCTAYPSAKDIGAALSESVLVFFMSKDLIHADEVPRIIGIIDDLVIGKEFSSKCGLLFNLTTERKEVLKKSVEFYSCLLSELENLLRFESTPNWIGSIVFLYKYKIHYLTVVKAIVEDSDVPQKTLTSLQTILDHTTNLLSINRPGIMPELLVNALRIKVEASIYQFIRKGGSSSADYREGAQANIWKLNDLVTQSATLKHDPELSIIVHTGRGIIYMPRSELDDVESSEYGPGESKLDGFLEGTRDTKNVFRKALIRFEEIGYGRLASSTSQPDLQDYHKLLIAFIVMSSMVLVKEGKTDYDTSTFKDTPVVDPFTFEEIRIVEDTPFVQILKEMYQDWMNCDVDAFYDSINQLGQLQVTLGYFIKKILLLIQSTKLWTKVAPNYDCLSIKDICEQLTYDKNAPMARDELLTLLMTSIMRGEAAVYYKIDFLNDLVYFGDEYKVPLTVGSHYQPSLQGMDESKSYEFANDVAVNSVESIHFKERIEVAEFFDQLKQTRMEHTHLPSTGRTAIAPDVPEASHQELKNTSAQGHQARLHEQFMKLVGMAEKNIDKLEKKADSQQRIPT